MLDPLFSSGNVETWSLASSHLIFGLYPFIVAVILSVPHFQPTWMIQVRLRVNERCFTWCLLPRSLVDSCQKAAAFLFQSYE